MFTIESNRQAPPQIPALASEPSPESLESLELPGLFPLGPSDQTLPPLSPINAHRVKFVPLLQAPDPDCSSWLNPETLPEKNGRLFFPDELNPAYSRLQTHFGVNPWLPNFVIEFDSPAGPQDTVTACVYDLKDGARVVGVRFGVGPGEVQLDLLGIVRDLYLKVIAGIPGPIDDSDAHRLQAQIWEFVWEMSPVVSSANSTHPGRFNNFSETSPKPTNTLFLSGKEDINGLTIVPLPNYIGLGGSPTIEIPLKEIINILTTHASYPIYPIMPGFGEDGITVTGTGTNPATIAEFCSNASGSGYIERILTLEESPFSEINYVHEVPYNHAFLDDVNPMHSSVWRAGPVIGCYSPTETPGKGQVMLYPGSVDVTGMTDFILESMGLGPDSRSAIQTGLEENLNSVAPLSTTSGGGKIFVVLGGYPFELPQFMRVLAAHALPNQAGDRGRTADSLRETWGSMAWNLTIEILAALAVLRFMGDLWGRVRKIKIFR